MFDQNNFDNYPVEPIEELFSPNTFTKHIRIVMFLIEKNIGGSHADVYSLPPGTVHIGNIEPSSEMSVIMRIIQSILHLMNGRSPTDTN